MEKSSQLLVIKIQYLANCTQKSPPAFSEPLKGHAEGMEPPAWSASAPGSGCLGSVCSHLGSYAKGVRSEEVGDKRWGREESCQASLITGQHFKSPLQWKLEKRAWAACQSGCSSTVKKINIQMPFRWCLKELSLTEMAFITFGENSVTPR